MRMPFGRIGTCGLARRFDVTRSAHAAWYGTMARMALRSIRATVLNPPRRCAHHFLREDDRRV